MKHFVERSDEPMKIVAGDFNAISESPQVITLTQEWSDSYRLANPSEQGFTCCIEDLTDGSEGALEKRIDYIFLVAEESIPTPLHAAQQVFAQPYETAYGPLWVSDHTGLFVKIQPGGEIDGP